MSEVPVSVKERAEERAETLRLEKKFSQKEMLANFTPFFGLVFIILLFSAVTGGTFLSSSNVANLVNQSFNLAIISVGVSFVYAHGGMDMSIGAVIGVSSLAGAYCWIQPEVPVIVGFAAAMAVGALCAFITSSIHVVARVPVFVASLCMKYICTGIITTAVSKSDVFINFDQFKFLNNGVLKLVVLLVILGLGYFAFEYTRLGKEMKAIGGNKTMAYQNGVKVRGRTIAAFLILGALIGVVAMFSLARVGNVNASTGAGMEFDAMTAIVLGGFPIQGGSKAKLRSAIVGAVTVAVLTNGLTLWGISPYLIYGIKGLLFLAIVGLSYERKKGAIVT